MPFRLRKDANEWFKHIGRKGPRGVDINFDMYYWCVMAGLAAKTKNPFTTDKETNELVSDFPQLYKEKSKILIALFLRRSVKEIGLNISDKRAIHNAISRLIDPDTSSKLSPEGMDLMNQYAHGGFDVLIQEFGDPPQFLETFLPMFAEFINKKANEN